MIKKAGELRTSRQDKLRDGNGTVEMIHFMEEQDSFGTGRLFSRATLKPGVSIGVHTHEGNFEIYYVLKGTAHVTDNGVPGILEAGDVMVCKDGDNHSIENKGAEPVEVLFLVLFTKGQPR